ncbi:ATP-binding protein [Bradyrhizobium prioriisuperbiae]|uniref:ATP-binding protein n=1 Tax=Bradyrhizobium prioriisuperbiae TaxID=2854389 RepID=UPI0028E6AB94|nr:ATP-binding protein [Bradyrhizobium prioritasuperba]
MSTERLADNAAVIDREIAWFRDILDSRFKHHGQETAGPDPLDHIAPPSLSRSKAPYATVIQAFKMGAAERLALILAYIPHIKPEILDPFLIHNQSVQRRFTEFGGLTGQSHGGFLPTGETTMFMLAGSNTRARLRFHHLFSSEHYFRSHNIMVLDHRHQDEPPLSSALRLTAEYVERLTTGLSFQPPYSPEFPAQLITTPFEWDDLVIDAATRQDLQDIITWVKNHDMLMNDWMLRKRLKAGYRSLFYGPPGTGKTLTASLLGKMTGLPVYRIDLSKVVSKYIGETEKNLASLFDHAQHQNWILFFDEADSLFGKRTETRNANDRAANQQVSYLLQRIEDFPGVVILATNLRTQLDEAFTRRFQSVTLFRMPNAEQRLRLWEDNFRDKPYHLASDVNLEQLAREYELSGGSIINVLRYACLQAVTRSPQLILAEDMIYGVRRELHKDGKFLS